MRDYAVIASILVLAVLALFNSYWGVLAWAWIAYFNPHRYGWGSASTFPAAIVIAVPTLVSFVFARKNRGIFVREMVLLLLLWLWFGFTTFYTHVIPALITHSDDATARLWMISKILLMTLVTICVVSSKDKLRKLILVILFSFGLRALFAAVFVIATGGQYRVWGPPDTFLADNNDFALALNMTIPLFFFFVRSEPRKWLRVVLWVMMTCVVISVIGTYSRGGLLGLMVVAVCLLAKSKHKFVMAMTILVASIAILALSAGAWKDRMGDFIHGKLDESEQSRLYTWSSGFRMVQDYPFTGGGFEAYTDPEFFARYLPPDSKDPNLHAPHSIYFQMLGEQGFIGLMIFLSLLLATFGRLRKLRKQAQKTPALSWVLPYTHMFEVSLIAYMTGGATLGRAYFDYSYELLACVIVLAILTRAEARSLASLEAEPTAMAPEMAVAAL